MIKHDWRYALTGILTACLTFTPANAADDKEVGILAGLGLTAATGKTELGENAGKIEGALLTAPMIALAADAIKRQSDLEKKFVLLADDQSFDIAQAEILNKRLALYLASIGTCAKTSKKDDGKKLISTGVEASDSEKAIDSKAARILTAAIGALKVDTNVRGFELEIPSAALASAISKMDKNFVQPGLISNFGETNPIAMHLAKLEEKRIDFAKCPDKEANKATVEALDKSIEDLLAPGKDGAPSAYENAARVFAAKGADALWPQIMRVRIVEAGGTLLNRSNIFLQFGFPGAVVMRSGLIAEYSIIDPKDGKTIDYDRIACRQHRSADMSQIYAKPNSKHYGDGKIDRQSKGTILKKIASCSGMHGPI